QLDAVLPVIRPRGTEHFEDKQLRTTRRATRRRVILAGNPAGFVKLQHLPARNVVAMGTVDEAERIIPITRVDPSGHPRSGAHFPLPRFLSRSKSSPGSTCSTSQRASRRSALNNSTMPRLRLSR